MTSVGPMSEAQPGWWQASDGKWYPPQAASPPPQYAPQQKSGASGCWKAFAIVCLVGIALVILVVVLAAVGINKAVNEKQANTPERMSLSEFNQIQTGMTRAQVSAIVGSPGTVEVESGVGQEPQFHTVLVKWDGAGDLGANANVTFQADKVETKAQFGLK